MAISKEVEQIMSVRIVFQKQEKIQLEEKKADENYRVFYIRKQGALA